jgi:hypothetical protein
MQFQNMIKSFATVIILDERFRSSKTNDGWLVINARSFSRDQNRPRSKIGLRHDPLVHRVVESLIVGAERELYVVRDVNAAGAMIKRACRVWSSTHVRSVAIKIGLRRDPLVHHVVESLIVGAERELYVVRDVNAAGAMIKRACRVWLSTHVRSAVIEIGLRHDLLVRHVVELPIVGAEREVDVVRDVNVEGRLKERKSEKFGIGGDGLFEWLGAQMGRFARWRSCVGRRDRCYKTGRRPGVRWADSGRTLLGRPPRGGTEFVYRASTRCPSGASD